MKRWTMRSNARVQAVAERDADLRARAEREAYQRRLEAFMSSLDAAVALTNDSLKKGIDLHAIAAAAESVAEFVDQAITIVTEEYRPALQCSEGCSFCCCKPGVLVTVPELIRVLSTIDSRFDANAKAELAARARRYASQIDGRSFDEPTNESVPCPLLVEGRCSVYDVRPLVCRGYNSTSVEACRAAHEDAQQLVPIFSVLKDVTDGAAVGVSQSLQTADANDAMVDLGSGLNLALASIEDFSERILRNSRQFPDIQNPTWAEDLLARVRATAQELRVRTDGTSTDGWSLR